MPFLPIAQRELAVAARKRTTFWVRLGVAGLAMLIGAVLLFIAWAFRSPRGLGTALFWTLASGANVFALLAGVLLTSDCIAEERREGTLGFLFLSDLRAHDVVVGKFLVNSLNAFYGLLAVLPVMAVAFVMGGVSPGEFGRMAVTLLDTMFLSLALGIAVSSRTSRQAVAMGVTFGVMAGLCALSLLQYFAGMPDELAWLSPVWLLQRVPDQMHSRRPEEFWWSALTINLAGWFCLAVAAWSLRGNWREPAAGEGDSPRKGFFGFGKPRSRLRRELLDENPVRALVETTLTTRGIAWAVALAGVTGLALLAWNSLEAVFGLSMYLPFFGLHWVIEGLVAWRACHWFAEARRSGELELLLSTPLNGRDLVDGQWRALRRAFLGPALLMVGALVIASVAGVFAMFGPRGPGWDKDQLVLLIPLLGVAIYQPAALALDFLALAWMGMWLGLTARRPAYAFAWTFALVVILPTIIPCVPRIVATIPVYVWAWSQLRQDLRRTIEQRLFAPAKRPRPVNAPPVLAARN